MSQNCNESSPEACSKGTPTPEEPSNKQSRSRKKTTPINIDDDDGFDPCKAKKRWTHDEEVILASAWLNNSNDSIRGGDKKCETFWKEITEEYNSQVPANRKRGSNQLQIRWTRLKTSINDINGFSSTVCKLHTSGYDNEKLMDEAQKMYANKHGKPFQLVHWWSTQKNEPKWCAYVERLEKEKNKSATIDVEDDRDQPRPIGREAAKAQLRGKRKKEQIVDNIVILGDNINKMVQMQKERKVEREKVSETQLQISKTNLKAAKEQKMSKIYEVYHTLINQDTSKMSENAKASREKTIQKMELKLFTDDDDEAEV